MGEAVATPVPLADAKPGDAVLKVTSHRVSVVTIDRATAKRLYVGRDVYARDGTSVARHELGGIRTRLSDPTPTVLGRLERERLEEAAAARERADAEVERRLNRRIAADWLAAQTDPQVIEDTVFPHSLDEVFEALQKARIV